MKYFIVINNIDKGNEPLAYKPGDVIQVLPETHKFSDYELNNPNWIIVKQDLLPIEVEAIMTQKESVDLKGRRKYKINLDKSDKNLSKKEFMDRVK